jgi:hypothetical protein
MTIGERHDLSIAGDGEKFDIFKEMVRLARQPNATEKTPSPKVAAPPPIPTRSVDLSGRR